MKRGRFSNYLKLYIQYAKLGTYTYTKTLVELTFFFVIYGFGQFSIFSVIISTFTPMRDFFQGEG